MYYVYDNEDCLHGVWDHAGRSLRLCLYTHVYLGMHDIKLTTHNIADILRQFIYPNMCCGAPEGIEICAGPIIGSQCCQSLFRHIHCFQTIPITNQSEGTILKITAGFVLK